MGSSCRIKEQCVPGNPFYKEAAPFRGANENPNLRAFSSPGCVLAPTGAGRAVLDVQGAGGAEMLPSLHA